MDAHLLFPDRPFDFQAGLPWQADALVNDLQLDILFAAMAQGDEHILAVARRVVLADVAATPDTALYRQGVLADCLRQPELARELLALAAEGVAQTKKRYWGYLPGSMRLTIWSALEHMTEFLGLLRKLRLFSTAHGAKFSAPGWRTFFRRVDAELDDAFFAAAAEHLRQLKFPDGVLLSAGLGPGNKGRDYVLHKAPGGSRKTWLHRLLTWIASLFQEIQPPPSSFTIHPRDEAGHQAIEEIQNRAVSQATKVLAQARDNVCSFYVALHDELAFHVGCLNLCDRLAALSCPWCLGMPLAVGGREMSFRGLYDVCLALRVGRPAVGNDVNADGKALVVVTGANQGGKSTFLRSVGLAQLMLQCGMPVAAESIAASLCDGVFTHFRREEDASLVSGKLDEEFSRMSGIVDHIARHPLILLNESFAATNEREGAEIGRQIITALVVGGARVVCVTHLFELADWLHARNSEHFLFLRAERMADGSRTFRLREGGPLRTSFGEDLYRQVFGASGAPQEQTAPAGAVTSSEAADGEATNGGV